MMPEFHSIKWFPDDPPGIYLQFNNPIFHDAQLHPDSISVVEVIDFE
jgi:hypothetical protein